MDQGRGRRREGRSLAECIPVVGDRHWTRVTWKGGGDLGTGEGRDVTLHVEMKQAKLFGLETGLIVQQ